MEIQGSRSKETAEFINAFSKLTTLIKEAFRQRTLPFNGEKYLDGNEICEFLHICQRTLQDYRDRGKIGYIQISFGKMLYKESDIIKLLEDNYVPERKQRYEGFIENDI